MNALAKRAASDRAGLLEQLMAVVRPESRVEVLVPAPEDPVLGVPDCAVPACDYPVSDHGLCNGHRPRWRARGRPPQTQFLADPGPVEVGPLHCRRLPLWHCRTRLVPVSYTHLTLPTTPYV